MTLNILTVGRHSPEIEKTFGTTGEWAGNILPKSWDIQIINYLGNPFISDDNAEVWVIAGSTSSVSESSVWMNTLIKQTSLLVKMQIPVLGICFGYNCCPLPWVER